MLSIANDLKLLEDVQIKTKMSISRNGIATLLKKSTDLIKRMNKKNWNASNEKIDIH